MDPSGFFKSDGSFYVIFGRILSKRFAPERFFSYIVLRKQLVIKEVQRKYSVFMNIYKQNA